ncbi:hypothetical protein [Actinomycetospora callitridis]|uniref:hypothetical protein n=1 Tax=Actinomycetospora callitridis TaxID=913944 RepID=UPI0023667F2A|nr:hypothetical protein [Actinomycetospora callitridis]MDD7918636.1 hypothetical protein [Actinomycetospora callitridis]
MDLTTGLIVAAVVTVVVYVGSLYRWPRKRCRRCYVSTGRDFAPRLLGRLVYRRCRKCNGKGWHTRFGRRLLGGRLDDDDMAYQGP